MYATNLADVARAAGLRVVEVRGWKTRGHGGLDAVRTIVCHHTAGPRSGNMPSLNVVTNGRPGLAGPLCNLALGRDGTVFVVAAGLAYHAGQVRDRSYANAFALGIEAENDGEGEPWPKVQRDAYVLLCAALVDAFALTEGRVLAHREVCYPAGRKIDPFGLDMDVMRRDVVAALRRLREPQHPSTALPAKPVAGPPFPLRAGWYFGPRYPLRNVRSVSGFYSHGDDLKVWQRRMRVRGWDLGITGRYDAQTDRVARAFRAEKGIGPGGTIGAKTWAAAWDEPVTR